MEKEIELARIENAIWVIQGLINYHKRMTLPIKKPLCADSSCPVIDFENDVYLSALEESLRLLRRELEGLNQFSGPFHT